MKPRVLVCGVEIAQDQTLRKLLQERAELITVQKTEEFEAASRSNRLDLVLFEFSDVWQGDMERLHALKISRPHLLVVVVDGGAGREAVIDSFRRGAADYFKKPYDPFLLAERVEALLQRKWAIKHD